MTKPQFPDFSEAPTGEVRAVLAQLDRIIDHLAADINRYIKQRGILVAELEVRPDTLTDDELEHMAARLGRRLQDMRADHPERDEIMHRVQQLNDEAAERRANASTTAPGWSAETVTRMLPRDRAELIVAEYAAGKPVRVIAETYGHSITTVRDYARGRRTPGEPAVRADDFAPFAGYCRRRLADDPHLRTPALLAELSHLGLGSSRATLYRSLERYGIQTHPCPDCHPASMSGYSLPDATRSPQPSPLPVPAAPVAGESLASFIGRLATLNRTTSKALLDILPPWFRIKARWHDDRWRPGQLTPWADDAAARLALISGTTTPAIRNALPAFGTRTGQPARALTACCRYTAARGIREPVPVHLPAHHQVCLKHGIWLSGPGTPQFSVSGCPDIIAAERQARRLLRHCTIEQLIYARIPAARQPGSPAPLAWKQRMHALITSNPRTVIESCPQGLFAAAGYPETVSAAAAAH